MSRRYANLDDLINDLDGSESLSDDPFGIGNFDDDDLAILGSTCPDAPRVPSPPKKAAKRGRKPKA